MGARHFLRVQNERGSALLHEEGTLLHRQSRDLSLIRTDLLLRVRLRRGVKLKNLEKSQPKEEDLPDDDEDDEEYDEDDDEDEEEDDESYSEESEEERPKKKRKKDK